MENGKLKAEAWIDEQKIRQISPLAYAYIMQGRQLEVSLGVFTEDEPTSGNWNGEDYVAIARSHRPDHLALLPGEQGACSWADGCGVRANQEEGGNDVDVIKTQKELVKEGLFVIKLHDIGFKGICNKIQGKLDAMDTDVKMHFLKDVFDSNFIYEVRGGGADGMFQRNYQVNEDETIEFTGEPEPVVQKVSYEPVQTNQTEGGITTMKKEKEEKKACCPEQVDLIINSEHTRFGEGDREWLEGQEKETIVKLLPVEPEAPATPQVNREQAVQVLKEQLSTPEQFLELMPKDIKDQMSHGLSLYQAERQELINHIKANTEVYTEDELKGMEIADLTKLAQAIKPKTDFSALGGGTPGIQANTEILTPTGVELN
jgi:hypothetical protein